MGIIFLFLFYAGLETAVYHNDLCLDPEASLCIGEGVADSVKQAARDLDDYVRESL